MNSATGSSKWQDQTPGERCPPVRCFRESSRGGSSTAGPLGRRATQSSGVNYSIPGACGVTHSHSKRVEILHHRYAVSSAQSPITAENTCLRISLSPSTAELSLVVGYSE